MSFNDFLCSLPPDKAYGLGGLVASCLYFFIFSFIFDFLLIRKFNKRISRIERIIYDKLHIDEENK